MFHDAPQCVSVRDDADVAPVDQVGIDFLLPERDNSVCVCLQNACMCVCERVCALTCMCLGRYAYNYVLLVKAMKDIIT
jgi:hypothetical protein